MAAAPAPLPLEYAREPDVSPELGGPRGWGARAVAVQHPSTDQAWRVNAVDMRGPLF